MTEVTRMTEMAEENMTGEKVKVPENFYATLIEDLMENCGRAYTF